MRGIIFISILLICCSVKAEENYKKFSALTKEDVITKSFSIAKTYFNDYQDPETYVCYGARLKEKDSWTSPEDVKAKKPAPWGYGSHIEDTALHCGHLLGALINAYNVRQDPFLYENCKKLFKALKFIYSVSPVPGLVPRGPHPNDKTACYDDSSMDQHTTYIISLALYANSSIADKEEKEFIKKSLQEVGERLEKYGWSIKQADGKTQSHVGFAWTGFVPEHASILLPILLALYKGTGNNHWLELYEKYGTEEDSRRWKLLEPGPHIQINVHPIYANQNCFRLNAFYQFENNPERKKIIYDLLEKSTDLQLEREFPGKWFEDLIKFPTEKVAQACNWEGTSLQGCEIAWKKFQPSFLDMADWKIASAASLSHIRFPLGGFHMVMLSEHKEMIKKYVPYVWDMINIVDLKKTYGGETNYLFTVVSLYLYAFYFNQ
ncbi:MAG: hypothetical protein AABY84_03520 [Candidatus Firestonebacteria bacterium]